jgi:hypothetical protein
VRAKDSHPSNLIRVVILTSQCKTYWRFFYPVLLSSHPNNAKRRSSIRCNKLSAKARGGGSRRSSVLGTDSGASNCDDGDA